MQERERERAPTVLQLTPSARTASLHVFGPGLLCRLSPGSVATRKANIKEGPGFKNTDPGITAKLWQHLNMNQCARTPA